MIRKVLTAALVLLISPASLAQDSSAYAQMGKATWSAFECSALASKLKKPADQERLFEFGYSQGKAFIAAIKAGKIERVDLSNNVPAGVMWLMEGPTPDFILGRIYESAQSNALKNIYSVGDHFNSEKEQELAASNKFSSSNCQLIGSGR
ncbi:hypothetical protein [Rhodanobacter sp. UC4436_H3]